MSNDFLIAPYAGSSGWSGTETSKNRADDSDKSGLTGRRQLAVIDYLDASGSQGLTWKELSDMTGWHHGTASGVLSVLHKADKISRLKATRNRCAIYVSNWHVYGRTVSQLKIKKCKHCGGVL